MFNQDLEAIYTQVLLDLESSIKSLNLSILMVGASARILIFDKPFKQNGRATQDLDIAVKVETWSNYQQLLDYLTQGKEALFKKTRISHKLIHIKTEIFVQFIQIK